MKIGANKAFEVIGTKACLNLNADVRTENERCGTMLNKGATAMRMP